MFVCACRARDSIGERVTRLDFCTTLLVKGQIVSGEDMSLTPHRYTAVLDDLKAIVRELVPTADLASLVVPAPIYGVRSLLRINACVVIPSTGRTPIYLNVVDEFGKTVQVSQLQQVPALYLGRGSQRVAIRLA